MRILVLLIPFAAENEVRTQRRHRLQTLRSQVGTGRVDGIRPAIVVFVSETYRHSKIFLPRKLRFRKHRLQERRNNLAFELRAVASRPIDLPPCHENAVRLAKNLTEIFTRLNKGLGRHMRMRQTFFKGSNIVDNDKLIPAEFLIQSLAERLRLVEIPFPYLGIARKHDLAVNAVGVRHGKCLCRHFKIFVDAAIVIAIRKLHENRKLCAGEDTPADHLAASRLRYAYAKTVHLAEFHRLDCLVPRRFIEQIGLGTLPLPRGILMERPFIPCMKEITALRSIL